MQGDERKDLCLPPPCSSSESTSGAKRNLPRWLEAAGQTPHCTFYKCKRAAGLQICQGQYTGIWSGIWSALFYGHSTIPTFACWNTCKDRVLLLPPLLTEPTSTAQPSAATSGAFPQPALQHSKAKHRDTELVCLWQHELFFLSVSVWQVQTFLLTSYLAINASPTLNAGSHRALTLTCMVAKNWLGGQKMRSFQSRSDPRDTQIPDTALFWSRNIDLDVLYCTGLESVSTSFRKAILAMRNPSLYQF